MTSKSLFLLLGTFTLAFAALLFVPLDASADWLRVNPPKGDYGSVNIGDSKSITFTISNLHTTEVLDVFLDSDSVSEPFSITTPSACTIFLAPGTSSQCKITYAPEQAGNHSANALFNGNGNEVTVPLNGTGFLPDPSPILPAEGDTVSVDTGFVYAWVVTGAPQYRIEVIDSSNAQFESSDVGTSSYITSTTYLDGSYRWRVGSCYDINCTGIIEWSDLVTFTVDASSSIIRTLTFSGISIKGGSGSISSSPAGIDCTVPQNDSCVDTGPYDNGTEVTLTANPAAGSTVSWLGCDTDVGNTCTIAMNADDKFVVGDFISSAPGDPSITSLIHSPDPVLPGTPVTFTAEASAVAPATLSQIVLEVFLLDARGDSTPQANRTCSTSPCSISGVTFSLGEFIEYTAQATDSNGNTSIRERNDFVVSSGGAGGSGSVLINGGDEITNERNVTLELECTGGCFEMRITNNLTEPGGAEVFLFSLIKSWELSPGDGVKAVYVEFKALGAGAPWHGYYWDLIELRTGSPETEPTGPIVFKNPLKYSSFTELINAIIDFLFTIAVIVAPILLVIAGVIFMTAAGDPGRIATARRMLTWTIVGFGIILISKGLVEVLKGILRI